MKHFLIKWLVFVGIICGVHTYYMTHIYGRISGDMGYMARIPFTREYNLRIRTFDYLDLDNVKSRLVDVDSASAYPYLLIGDSFTEPENALGHNISETVGDTVRVICDLYSNGYIPTQVLWYGMTHDRFRPGQTIVLESVGRMLKARFADIDLTSTTLPDNMQKAWIWREDQSTRSMRWKDLRDNGVDIEPFTLNGVLTWIRYKLKFKRSVRHESLTCKLFDNDEYGSELYYYRDDIRHNQMTPECLTTMAHNTNALFDMAEKKGINLYLFLIPDKHDLYYPYIDNPAYPRTNVLDFVKEVDTRHLDKILNLKDTLGKYLERGELDIFRCNDGHWSVYAAEEMGRVVAKKINAAKIPES